MATIVRYAPVSPTSRWATRSSIDRLFDRVFEDAFRPTSGAAEPTLRAVAANLYETPEAYWVELPLPGVKPEDLEVTVREKVIDVKAKRTAQVPENAQTHWRGFAPGQWQRRFTLPGEVNAEGVEAHLEHGVLRLQLPKADHLRPRTIKVSNGSAGSATADAAEADVAGSSK
ncbi:MAG: Hsp20/alpha crystallin family protein [Chloroflexota bacterium]